MLGFPHRASVTIVYKDRYGSDLARLTNAEVGPPPLPRIGETVEIAYKRYRVRNVMHFMNDSEQIQIHVTLIEPDQGDRQ